MRRVSGVKQRLQAQFECTMSAAPQPQIESSVDKMNAPTAKAQTPPAHVGMFQLLNGVLVVGAVSCVAWLGIPDLVEHGPKPADELATAIGADPRALYRLMRATACVGVLSEGPDGKFSETPLSAVLRSNANPSLRTFAIMHGRDWHGLGWSHLDYCVRTGKQALDKIYGMPIFQFFEQHPEEGQLFQQSMTDLSTIDGPAVAADALLAEIHCPSDVGRGHGLSPPTNLAGEPHLKGTLYDMPHVVAGAKDG